MCENEKVANPCATIKSSKLLKSIKYYEPFLNYLLFRYHPTFMAEMEVTSSEPSMAEMTTLVEETRVRIGQLWDEGLVTIEMLLLCIVAQMYNIKSNLVDKVVLYMPKKHFHRNPSCAVQIGEVYHSIGGDMTYGRRLNSFNIPFVSCVKRAYFVCPAHDDLTNFVWLCRKMEDNFDTAFDHSSRDEVEWVVSISWTKIKQTLDLILIKPQKHLRPVEHLVVEEVSKVLPVNDVPELVSSFLENSDLSQAAIQSVCGKN